MKKVIVIGASGQLGQYLVQAFAEKSDQYQLIALSRAQVDLVDIASIKPVLASYQADIIINATAYTAVDQAESEAKIAMQVNAEAPEKIANIAAKQGIPLIHYSTDYVFAGDASSPYQVDFPTNPQGEYGRTKLAGEQKILSTDAQAYIFRTAWVYSNKGNNFYKTMLRLAESRNELNIVNDQIGSPTYAKCIAEATLQIVDRLLANNNLTAMQASFPRGLYHLTNAGETSWADFAKEIFKLHELNIQVSGIPSSEYPTPAKRPAYSVLDNKSLNETFGVELPSWQNALHECVEETHSAS